MTSSDSQPNVRLLYIWLPFLLLLSFVGLTNLVPRWLNSPEAETHTSPTPFTIQSNLTTTQTPPPSLLPSIASTPATPPTQPASPTAIIPPEATIRLLGPPEGSTFQAGTFVTFYWEWPLTLQKGQQFVVYLLVDGQTNQVGTVAEANLGSSYRLQTMIDEGIETAVSLQWLVHLEDTLTAVPLVQSESRTITIIPANN